MKKTTRSKGYAMPAVEQESERWRAQDKFLIVIETVGFSEAELADYCRSKGLYVEQVQTKRDGCMQANGGVAQRLTELQKDLRKTNKEKKKLEQELRRKDAALAETAALLVLRKKVHAILGDGKDV